MDNFFKQERLELDLFYIQNVFSSNRYFNFSESFEQNNILYAKNTKNNSNLTSILERELHIRKIIKKVFQKYPHQKNIRFYYKLYYDFIWCDGKRDKRYYEYFRIIYQSNNGDLIYDERKLDRNSNVYQLIKESLKKIESIIKTISNMYSKKKEIVGQYDIVLPTYVSGFFIHELIGHFLEDDFFLHPLTIIDKNTKCSNILNVYDLSLIHEDHYIYDDSGNKAHNVHLINNGKIIAYLSNKSGNKRRQDYSFRSLTRMRTTYIAPISSKNTTDFTKEIYNGIYVEKFHGGNVNPINGDYMLTGFGFLIVNGEKSSFISKLKIEGNIIGDLLKITDIGNDLEYQGVECIKKNQIVHVGVYSPTMIIKNIKASGVVYE